MRVLKALLPLLLFAFSCTKPDFPGLQEKDTTQQVPNTESDSNITGMEILISAGGKTATATLVDNAATGKLRELLSNGPLSYSSSDNGFETYGDIGQTLPTSNESITAAPGDILLYSGRYICIFWGANTYSYTRLGRVKGMSADEIKDMFNGDVQVKIQKKAD